MRGPLLFLSAVLCTASMNCVTGDRAVMSAGKNIKKLRERFGIETAEMFANEGLLAITCTETELPKAEKMIEYVKEFLREIKVGDVFKGCKVRCCTDMHLLTHQQFATHCS